MFVTVTVFVLEQNSEEDGHDDANAVAKGIESCSVRFSTDPSFRFVGMIAVVTVALDSEREENEDDDEAEDAEVGDCSTPTYIRSDPDFGTSLAVSAVTVASFTSALFPESPIVIVDEDDEEEGRVLLSFESSCASAPVRLSGVNMSFPAESA
jgi:hypothetical protein